MAEREDQQSIEPVVSAPAGRRSVRWLIPALLLFTALGAVGFRLVADPVSVPEDAVRTRMIAVPAPERPPPSDEAAPAGADVAPRVAYDVLADLPDDMRLALMASEADADRPFRYQLAVPPAIVCGAMAEEGLANEGWVRVGGEWQCASDLVPVAPPGTPSGTAQDDAAPSPTSTLFFAARGPSEDHLAIIRFKLNLDDPGTAKVGTDHLMSALDRLSGPLAWSLPVDAADAIRGYRRLSAFDRGITIEIHPEAGEIRRINVVLLLEHASSLLPSDRFERLPPETQRRLVR